MGVEAPVGKLEALLEMTRQRIREDAKRVPSDWQPLFAELQERIFDPFFKFGAARRRFGLKAAEHKKAFIAALGCSPLDYIRSLRLGMARELLASQKVRRWKVAHRAGFSSAESLRAALRREENGAGLPGSDVQKVVDIRQPPRIRRSYAPFSPLRRLLCGAGDPREAQSHRDRLAAALRVVSQPTEERVLAGAWWGFVREIHAAGLRALVGRAPFKTPALFELLCEKSREEGRDDRQRGVLIAELALAALEPLAAHVEPAALRHLTGKGWACLGNARCLASDLAGAEAAFATADGLLPQSSAPAELRAELRYFQSCLRCAQRRASEGLELVDEALELLADRTGRLAVQVHLARAQALSHLGRDESALPALQSAMDLLAEKSEPLLSWIAHQNLASTLWRLGRLEEAADWLNRSELLAAQLGQLAPRCHGLWLAGLIAEELGRLESAAARLREACAGLGKTDAWGYFAVAALDLARLEAGRGELGEALRWIAQALPHLEVLKLEQEGLAALALLRKGLLREQLLHDALGRLRREAGHAVGAPPLANKP